MSRYFRGRPDYFGGAGRFRGLRRPYRYSGYRRPYYDRGDFTSGRVSDGHQQRYHPRFNRYRESDGYSHTHRYHHYPSRHPAYRFAARLRQQRYEESRYRSSSTTGSDDDDIVPPSPSEDRSSRRSRETRSPSRKTRSRSRYYRRGRRSATPLSDISSGSSCFGTVFDSDAYESPDYDEVTSEEDVTEEDDEMDTEEEHEEQIAKQKAKRKKRKKDKKKKEKEREKRQRRKEKRRKKEILEERICPPEHEVTQSKEIFSSGKNILVSVSFADGEKPEPGEESPGAKHHKKSKKKKSSRKKAKSSGTSKRRGEDSKNSVEGTDVGEKISSEFLHGGPKRKRKLDDNVKPVLIIDLERSPGQQVISSPREVIVLSDGEDAGVKKKVRGANEIVGPNTPPEPAPKSPESYDPFDPTKSSTQSPISGRNLGSISTVSYPDLPQHHSHHHPAQHHHRRNYRFHIPLNNLLPQVPCDAGSGAEFYDDGVLDLHPSTPAGADLDLGSTPRGGSFGGAHYRQSPQKLHHHYRNSPLKKANFSGVPMPSATITSGGAGGGLGYHHQVVLPPPPFEDDMVDDDDDDGDISPYSPRSSDCDEHMFDPPADDGNFAANGSQQPKTIALTVDNLRKVFGNDKKTLYGDLRRPNEAVVVVDEMYKPQKVTMEMLDEIPNSAVDLQVKEKLIQKLQRQERIIEEVKHFLKPHFNKKRIDKDEYKEIMKKSVPKICHSRSGEINPVKISNLITAYVKKAIAKRRLVASGNHAIVSSTTAVT